MSRANRVSLVILATFAICAAFWIAFAVWVAPALIESGWRGESIGVINGAFSGGPSHPLDEYLAEWRGMWRGLLVNWLGLMVLVAIMARPETRALARRAFGSNAREVFHSTPKFMIAVIVLSLAVGEWYPFSQFPMYSTFAREGAYVMLTDGADEPIAARPRIGMGLDAVQKIFLVNLEEERERRGITPPYWYLGGPTPKDDVAEAAAVRTLRYLRDERLITPEPLRLWRARITLHDGVIDVEPELLGEVPAE